MTLPPVLSDVSTVQLDANEIIEQQLSTSIVNKVLNVLKNGLNKLKISLIIIQALQTPEILKSYVHEDEIKILMRKCEIMMKNTNYWDKQKTEEATLNHHLAKMIESLSNNKKFMCHIPDNMKESSKLSNFLLKEIEDIFDIAELRLQTSASANLTREKLVQEAYKENELLKESISVCRNVLEVKDKVLQEKINKETETTKFYKSSLEEAKGTYEIEVKKARDEACQKIIQITSNSEVALERLKEDTERSRNLYEGVLRDNLLEEKKLREKKQRVLAQLIALIEKYDNDMTERYLEVNQMKDKIIEKKKELENFMVVFNEKQKEYHEMFKDEDDEDETRRDRKVWNFQMNHAAKVIQRAWREYLARKKKKKKGKGKGRGKAMPKTKVTKEKKEPKEKSEDAEKKPKGPKGKKPKIIVKEDSVDTNVGGEEAEKAKIEEVAVEKDKEADEIVVEKQEGDEEEKETGSEVVAEKQEGDEEKKEADNEVVAEKQEGGEERKEEDIEVVAEKQEGDEEKKEGDNEVAAEKQGDEEKKEEDSEGATGKQEGDEKKKEADSEDATEKREGDEKNKEEASGVATEKQEGDEEKKEADSEVITGQQEGDEEKKESDSDVVREKQEGVQKEHAEEIKKVEFEEGNKDEIQDRSANQEESKSKPNEQMAKGGKKKKIGRPSGINK